MERIATVIIENSRGQFFVHRRTLTKRLYPGKYGIGAGGKIVEGESPDAGAKRELREETGIEAAPKFLFSLKYESLEAKHKLFVFWIRAEVCPSPDNREWDGCGWVEAEALDRLLADGALCPDTALFYQRFLEEQQSEANLSTAAAQG